MNLPPMQMTVRPAAARQPITQTAPPVRFGAVAYVQFSEETPEDMAEVMQIFAKALKESYAKITRNTNVSILMNRLVPYSIYFNHANGITLTTTDARTVLFTDSHARMLAAICMAYKEHLCPLVEKDELDHGAVATLLNRMISSMAGPGVTLNVLPAQMPKKQGGQA